MQLSKSYKLWRENINCKTALFKLVICDKKSVFSLGSLVFYNLMRKDERGKEFQRIDLDDFIRRKQPRGRLINLCQNDFDVQEIGK